MTPLSTLLVAYEVIIPTLCPCPQFFFFQWKKASQRIENTKSKERMIEVKLSPWNVLALGGMAYKVPPCMRRLLKGYDRHTQTYMLCLKREKTWKGESLLLPTTAKNIQ